jgi:hypothetical protein
VKLQSLLKASILIGTLILLLGLVACNDTRDSQSQTSATPSPTQGRSDPQLETKAFETQYKVKPVFPPPLKRPPVSPTRENLPKGAAGALPTFDGEPFQINFTDSGNQNISPDQVTNIINQVTKALAWDRKPEELKLAQKTTSPGAKPEVIKNESERARRDAEKSASGRLGRLSQSTEKAINDQAEQAKADAARSQDVLFYDQRVDGVRIENSGIQAIMQSGKGLVSIQGRIFNQVNITNDKKLTEDEAIKAATAYLNRSTKVVQSQSPRPELVILPYGDAMRFAWRLELTAEEGSYRLWLDASTGEVLELEPLFASDSATGLVFNPNPTAGTTEQSFEVGSPSGGNYQLLLTGRVNENNSGADASTSADLTLADAGTGSANFNVSPINSTAVERTNVAGYNSRFQEVNAYGWVASTMKNMEGFGSRTFPSVTVTVNHNNPCGFGINNACGGSSAVTFGIGSATNSTSTSSNALFNSAIDATVVTHEFGHVINRLQDTGTLLASQDEGLADFWAATVHNTDTFGGWWKHNGGSVPVQTGFVPRQAEALDVFPEHRAFSTDGHADGQIINWALWSTRTGLNNQGALGTLVINVNLLKALTTAGVGLTNGGTDKRVHDSYLNLLRQLTTQFTGGNINKLLSGFARAGILLSERDAVIDINDDFLSRGSATGPTFTIWSGRDYQFTGETATATNVFNPRFEVEVANDAAFTVNRVASGLLSTVAVTAQGVPQATWQLPAANWNTLKTANTIFYRVTTQDNNGANVRSSLSPGNGFIASVPPPSATINESGQCECNCNATMAAPQQKGGLPWVLLLPLLVALLWRMRLQSTRYETTNC